MKLLACAAFLSIFPSMRAAQPAIDKDRLLAAIFEIEQGEWKNPGGRGNISYSAWSDSSDLPYQASGNESLAMPVYRKHLEKLTSQLRAAGVRVNPQTLGTCWRWGFEGARRRHWKSDQGDRTANLYYDLKSDH